MLRSHDIAIYIILFFVVSLLLFFSYKQYKYYSLSYNNYIHSSHCINYPKIKISFCKTIGDSLIHSIPNNIDALILNKNSFYLDKKQAKGDMVLFIPIDYEHAVFTHLNEAASDRSRDYVSTSVSNKKIDFFPSSELKNNSLKLDKNDIILVSSFNHNILRGLFTITGTDDIHELSYSPSLEDSYILFISSSILINTKNVF